MAFINTGFTAAFAPLWTALEMDPPDPDLQASLRRFGLQSVIERHDKLEAMLRESPHAFLAGERPTLADALFIGVARWLDFHGAARPDRWPFMAALRGRLEADAAVQFALAIENGEMAQARGACRGHVALADLIEQAMPV